MVNLCSTYKRNFDILGGVTLRASRWQHVFYFNIYFPKCNKFVFSYQMSLKIIDELLKNAPVRVKR